MSPALGGGFFFLNINLFIYLFMAELGLRCCVQAFSSCSEWGLLFVVACGFLIVVASLCCGAWALGAQASVVVARGLSSCVSSVLECRLSSCGTWASLLRSMWEYSRTRAQTRVPCVGRQILNHCTTREVPTILFYLFIFWPHLGACRISVPQPGIEPRPRQ